MVEFLVIGYGNTLRGDDGVGYRIAEIVADWGLQQVRSLPVHQLTPELSAEIASSRVVVFVDARVSEGEAIALSPDTPPHLELQPLSPTTDATLGHTATPTALLALTQSLFGVTPTAYHLLIPATQFEFQETLSPLTQQAMATALDQIHQML